MNFMGRKRNRPESLDSKREDNIMNAYFNQFSANVTIVRNVDVDASIIVIDNNKLSSPRGTNEEFL